MDIKITEQFYILFFLLSLQKAVWVLCSQHISVWTCHVQMPNATILDINALTACFKGRNRAAVHGEDWLESQGCTFQGAASEGPDLHSWKHGDEDSGDDQFTQGRGWDRAWPRAKVQTVKALSSGLVLLWPFPVCHLVSALIHTFL